MDFPVHEKSISNSETELIKQGMIQNRNSKMSFYPDLIYRSPLKPTENLQLPRIESKTDAILE